MIRRWFKMLELHVRQFFYGRQRGREAEARQAAHDLANEVQMLEVVSQRIQRAPSPWHELVKAVRGSAEKRK